MGVTRHLLFVIGDTGESAASGSASARRARAFTRWLALRSDGALVIEYLSTLEDMYLLVPCDDLEVTPSVLL